MSTWCFNFKAQFAPDVESGKKHQTIRARRKDGRRPKIGDRVQCYTGLRSKRTQLLTYGSVHNAFWVTINFELQTILLNGVELTTSAANKFAQRDGFVSCYDMITWFQRQYGGDQFDGFCTIWVPDLLVTRA